MENFKFKKKNLNFLFLVFRFYDGEVLQLFLIENIDNEIYILKQLSDFEKSNGLMFRHNLKEEDFHRERI